MAENITEQQLNDESQKLKLMTEKIEKVKKYVDNDLNKAKDIVNGKVKDFIILKGKISDEKKQKSGLFLLFLCKNKPYIIDKFCVFKNDLLLGNSVKIDENWKSFFVAITNNMEKSMSADSMALKILTGFDRDFRPGIIQQILQKFDNRDLNHITMTIQRTLEMALNDRDFALTADMVEESSLEYEEFVKPMMGKLWDKKPEEQKKQDGSQGTLTVVTDEVDIRKNELINEGNVVLKGEFSLSPIKGKFLSEIIQGDTIGVKINDNSQKAVNIINQFNLVTPEGKVKRIKGKVIMIKKTEKGFCALVQIAPLVILNIVEEEELKVEYFSTVEQIRAKKEKKKQSSLIPVVIITSVLTTVVLIVLIMLFVY